MTPDIAELKKLAERADYQAEHGILNTPDDQLLGYSALTIAFRQVISALEAAEARADCADQIKLQANGLAHHWKTRAETAEKERDEAREALKPFVDLSSQSAAAAVALNNNIRPNGLCEVKVLKSQFLSALNASRATLHQEQKEKA